MMIGEAHRRPVNPASPMTEDQDDDRPALRALRVLSAIVT
jgi:hypothetical protein